jgi:hypothetical protein
MALVITGPSLRVLKNRASKYRIGYTAETGRDCHARMSSMTASVTLAISVGETSTP